VSYTAVAVALAALAVALAVAVATKGVAALVKAAAAPGRGVLGEVQALARRIKQLCASARAWEGRFRARKAADLLL
jgi:hypothetical protein